MILIIRCPKEMISIFSTEISIITFENTIGFWDKKINMGNAIRECGDTALSDFFAHGHLREVYRQELTGVRVVEKDVPLLDSTGRGGQEKVDLRKQRRRRIWLRREKIRR